ncbi:MAG: FG-GAP repeat protein [Pseudomonadales bacterium]|nr:FG-GAP repeat protein [Pseudomonadales bacterium]
MHAFKVLFAVLIVCSSITVFAVPADIDDDGLPNFFEDSFGLLDSNNPLDAILDLDSDGWSNLSEYRAGTIIDDPSSNPATNSNFLHQKLFSSDGAQSDLYGNAVDVDGNVAVVGANRSDQGLYNSGAVFIYERINGIWLETQKLVSSDLQAEDLFGYSVAIEGDKLLVGAPFEDEGGFNAGAVYYFQKINNQWTQIQKIYQSGYFGFDVDISGNRAIIGAHNYLPDSGGTAFIYELENGFWNLHAELHSPNGKKYDSFGSSVAIDGETALVGASGEFGPSPMSFNAGSAYIFNHDIDGWDLHQRLQPSELSGDDHFGRQVAIHQSTIVVGAPYSSGQQNESGAVYIYNNIGSQWLEHQKIIPHDIATENEFGNSVSISGDQILVGATSPGRWGVAYLFNSIAGYWYQAQKLVASDGEVYDAFGIASVISDDTVIVGSNGDGAAYGSGSAYVFDLNNFVEYDTDADGLWDTLEAILGTDINLADTDNDGVDDYEEVNQDGNATNYTLGIDLDPNNPDSDGDGLLDGLDSEPLVFNESQHIPLPLWSTLLIGSVLIWIGQIRQKG